MVRKQMVWGITVVCAALLLGFAACSSSSDDEDGSGSTNKSSAETTAIYVGKFTIGSTVYTTLRFVEPATAMLSNATKELAGTYQSNGNERYALDGEYTLVFGTDEFIVTADGSELRIEVKDGAATVIGTGRKIAYESGDNTYMGKLTLTEYGSPAPSISPSSIEYFLDKTWKSYNDYTGRENTGVYDEYALTLGKVITATVDGMDFKFYYQVLTDKEQEHFYLVEMPSSSASYENDFPEYKVNFESASKSEFAGAVYILK